MKVVIDTNIFISSFYGGNPQKIIDLWIDGKIILCLSKAILEEYMEVIRNAGLDNEEKIQRLLKYFSTGFNILFTTKTPDIKVIEKDPDDDKFIECAIALGAEFIITGDYEIQCLGEYRGIKILSPKKFLENYKHKYADKS